MQCAPFDVQPIIARLKALVPALRNVAGAADYASLTKLADFLPPCAYVLLARERADANPPGNAMPGTQVTVRQRVNVSFGVVLAVRNYREQLGAQSADDLKTMLGAIRAALLGWIPDVPGGHPCMLQRGDLVQYSSAVSVWTDVYTTSQFIGVTP